MYRLVVGKSDSTRYLCAQVFIDQVCAGRRSYDAVPPTPWAVWTTQRSHSVVAEVALHLRPALSPQPVKSKMVSDLSSPSRGALPMHSMSMSVQFITVEQGCRHTEHLDVNFWNSPFDFQINPTG